MTEPTKEEQRPLLSPWARVGVTVALLVIALPFFGAFLLGWTSGLQGKHKGEVDEAIRDVLVALALVAVGLMLVVMFMGAFWLYIAGRLNKLERQQGQISDQSKPGT
jgi:hypothetical protein